MFSSLRYPSFRLLWIGQTTSRLGDSIFNVASYWLLWETTRSAAIVGFAGAVSAGAALLGFASGVFVDKWDRRRILVWSDTIRALVVLLVPALLLVHRLHWSEIVAVSLAINLIGQFFTPAYQAVYPDLLPVQSVSSAAGLLFVAEQAALMGGALIAGTIVIPLGPQWAYVIDSATFVISVAAVLAARLPSAGRPDNKREPQNAGALAMARESWRYIVSVPFLRVSTPLIALLYFFFTPFLSLLTKWSDDVLRTGALGYGILEVAYPLGMASGGLLAAPLESLVKSRLVLILGFLTAASAVVAFIVSRRLLIAAVMLGLVGFGVALANVVFVSLQQKTVPSEMRGRYFATTQSMITLALPLGYLASGVLADRWGITRVFLATGISLFLGTLVVIFSRAFHGLPGTEASGAGSSQSVGPSAEEA